MANQLQQERLTPSVKCEGYETSPAESFLSDPGHIYDSLFSTTAVSDAPSPDYIESLTPQSYVDDKKSDLDLISALAAVDTPPPCASSTTTSEKKPVKKRKSWGQVLPEPKTNLPPRKRAKTEDEKEQRRVERVLRNRRAAQSSRERKRQEVEKLEHEKELLQHRNKSLQMALHQVVEELNKYRRANGAATLDQLGLNPVTLSHELFSSRDGHISAIGQSSNDLMSQLGLPNHDGNTVNPAALSPELNPVPDSSSSSSTSVLPEVTQVEPAVTSMEKTSFDVTQHPAEMLCDLQCPSTTEVSQSWVAASLRPMSPALSLYLQLATMLSLASTVASIFRQPLSQIACSLLAGLSLPPTRPILTTIIWLVTRPRRHQTSAATSTSNSMTFFTKTPTPPTRNSTSRHQQSRTPWVKTLTCSALRIKSLQKILTCSPSLARPLSDATMAVLRLVTDGSDDRAVGLEAGPLQDSVADGNGRGPREWWPFGDPLPSREVLLTLLWAIRVEERRIERGNNDYKSKNILLSVHALARRPVDLSRYYQPMMKLF